MRTIWTRWDLADMQDAADAEGPTALAALAVPEQRLVETLPYYGAFADYQAHVTRCPGCRRDDRPDCSEGETSLAVSRVGVEERTASPSRTDRAAPGPFGPNPLPWDNGCPPGPQPGGVGS